MATVRRSLLPLLLAGSLAGLPAQERRPLLGTVVDADGKPVAHATVRLAFVPLGAEHLEARDHPQATADERGRFRVDVLPCTSYRLWATGPRDEQGNYLASGLTQANTGQLVALQATVRHPARRLLVRGAEAWPGLLPLRVRVLPDCVELPELTFPLPAEGHVALPPLPDAFTTVEVLTRDGDVLYAQQLKTTGNLTVGIPKPCTIPLHVVDEKGAPVAGATVRSRAMGGSPEGSGLLPGGPARSRWRPLGTTDADGALSAEVPCDRDPFAPNTWPNLFFLAHKAGFAGSVSGIGQEPFCDGVQVKGEKDLAPKGLRFTLRRTPPLRARFLAGPQPLAATRVAVRAEFRITTADGNGWINEELVWQPTTDAEGRIEIADLPPNCHEVTFVVAANAGALGLTEAVRKECPQHPVMLHRLAEPPATEVVVDLAQCKPLHLRLLDEGKAPARDARILLISRATGDGIDAWAPQVVPNGSGHATVLLQPGDWALFARDRTGFAFLKVDGQQEQEALLPFEPMPSMRGKVVDQEGRPVAGARMHGVSMSVMGMGGRQPELDALAQHLSWTWIQATRTGADGAFDCRLLSLPNMRFQGQFVDESAPGRRRSPAFTIAPGDEPLTVTIQ